MKYLPVFGDLLLLGVVPLPLLRLDPRQLLGRQGLQYSRKIHVITHMPYRFNTTYFESHLEVCRVLRVWRAAGRAVARPLCPDFVPAEAADLKNG